MAPLDHTGRTDGLSNVATGLGVPEIDTRLLVERERYGPLAGRKSPAHWSLEYQQSWMAQSEIDDLADDMYREGVTLTDTDEDFPMADVMEIIDGPDPFERAGGTGFREGYLALGKRLKIDGDKVGGAVMLAILDDGLDPAEPIDLDRIQSIEDFEILDRGEIQPWMTDGRRRPQHYIIGDISDNLRVGQVIHASRLFIHPGKTLSRREMRARGWWGASKLELLQRERRGAEESAEYQRGFMQRCSFDTEVWAELNELLQQKDEDGNPIGEALIQQRLAVNARFETAFGKRLLDGGKSARENRAGVKEGGRPPDSIASVARTTGELVPLGEQQLTLWQRGTGKPPSIAFGAKVGNLSSGENLGDWQSWSGQVSAEQDDFATPLLKWQLTLLFASKAGPTNGPQTFNIKWNPLLKPTPLQAEQLRTERAKGDATYVDIGAALPTDVRKARFVDGSTMEISLDDAEFGDDAPSLTGGPTDDLALAAAGTDVQQQALNGAQIKSLVELSSSVAAGLLPQETAIWLITVSIPGIDEASARTALQLAASFTPTTTEIPTL